MHDIKILTLVYLFRIYNNITILLSSFIGTKKIENINYRMYYLVKSEGLQS